MISMPPRIDTATPSREQLAEVLDWMDLQAAEILASVKAAIAGDLRPVEARLELAAQAALYSTVAAQLALLVLNARDLGPEAVPPKIHKT